MISILFLYQSLIKKTFALMKAYFLNRTCDVQNDPQPLQFVELETPQPARGEVLIEVSVCGICHTDLDEIEGRTSPPAYPVIPGHQVIGRIVQNGEGCKRFQPNDRVGIAWIFSACGNCIHCLNGNENLCENFMATGRDRNGGYAEYITAHEDFVYAIPDFYPDSQAAPLLCAGAIGYRSLKLCQPQNEMTFGLMGFGASAHIVIQLIRYIFPQSEVYVFARESSTREFALKLGATWTGDIAESPPRKVDRIIDTTPAWKPVVEALKHLAPGGRLIMNAIRKENADLAYFQNLQYETHLWHEKEIKSVANITRKDVEEFLQLAVKVPIEPQVTEYPFEKANQALHDLKAGKGHGAKVLRIQQSSKTPDIIE